MLDIGYKVEATMGGTKFVWVAPSRDEADAMADRLGRGVRIRPISAREATRLADKSPE